MDYREVLYDSCKKLGVILTDYQIDNFMNYYRLLVDWNNKINLTAITELEEVINKHFIDSLTIMQVENFNNNSSIIDVGTGAGFPGIPLKIVNPEMKITLLDSLNKRINFLNLICEKLELKNIDCIHGRAEELGKSPNFREKYDYSVSRAVARLPILMEYCVPFVKKGGKFISLKGPNIDDEINESKKAFNELNCKLKDIKYIQIPNTDYQHNLVIVEKNNKTPLKYPRNQSKIKKNPLG